MKMLFLASLLLQLTLVALGNASSIPPAFCKGDPCPEFTLESTEASYETRLYKKATWASTTVEGLSRVEIAPFKALKALTRYLKGDNEELEKVAAGKPTTVLVYPKFKFTAVENNFTVAYFLPEVTEKTAPVPADAKVKVTSSPQDAELYVFQFGGFATTGKILSSAAQLATALEADNVPYDEEKFVFANYNGWSEWVGRHNEIWMSSDWEKVQRLNLVAS